MGHLRRRLFYLGYCNKENVYFVKEREGIWVLQSWLNKDKCLAV